METETRIFIEERIYENSFAIYGAVKTREGRRFFKAPEVGDIAPDYSPNPEAFLRLTPDVMQDIFNQLWKIGLRPKDGTGNSGHIAALQYHLEDMRNLVFRESK